MGERPITKGNGAPELISEKERQHTHPVNLTRVLIASIVAISLILIILFMLAALRPEEFPSALSTAFTIFVSVFGSGLISWFSSAYHSKKGFQRNLNQYAATAMDHIDYLSTANSMIREEVEGHIKWLTETDTPGQDVVLEKLMRLEPPLKLMEAAVFHALVSWKNLAPERFEELVSAIQRKLREEGRMTKLEQDVDALKSKIAAAKTDEEKQEFARKLEERELEKEEIKQEIASTLIMPPSGFHTASVTIPVQKRIGAYTQLDFASLKDLLSSPEDRSTEYKPISSGPETDKEPSEQ